MKEKEVYVEVPLGPSQQDYQLGNFLNAVDTLCCHFAHARPLADEEMADALELYAKNLRA